MDKIPIIDCYKIAGDFDELNTSSSSSSSFAHFATEFGDALSKIGFVYLVNHGIDLNTISKTYELSRSFFTLPAEIKRKYRKTDPLNSFHGYSSGLDDELSLDEQAPNCELKEVWDVWGKEAHLDKSFPEEVPGFKSAFDSLRIDCVNLTLKLLKCLGIYLELPDQDFFLKCHRGLADPEIRTQTQFQSTYYFPLKTLITGDITTGLEALAAKDVTRCGTHSDWGTITLLMQDMVGGLEIQNATGQWIQAIPVQNSILINTGQILELWSGGRLPASPHRVKIPKEESLLNIPRQSLIYFVDPDGHIKIEPMMPILAGKEHLASKAPFWAYDYSQERKEIMIKQGKSY